MTGGTPFPEIHIHYRRLPGRTDVYVQELVLDDPAVKVTYQPATPLRSPITVGGAVILEPGSPVVWFTFPGVWHDIGRFHDAAGRFTGVYANVLTPCEMHHEEQPLRWDTTDLFLDVWMTPSGGAQLLDEPELASALAAGHISSGLADSAAQEAGRILELQGRGAWPPAIVGEWTLERVLELRGTDPERAVRPEGSPP